MPTAEVKREPALLAAAQIEGDPTNVLKQAAEQANFALVSEEAGTTDAGIELVLGGGRRLRISKGVDEPTLRAVLAAVEPKGC